MAENALKKAEQKLANRDRKIADMEYEAEESHDKARAIMMTMGQDLAEEAGGILVAELAAADLPFHGETLGIIAGGLAQAVRPFLDPFSGARLATAPFQGMIVGGLTLARFRKALARSGRTITELAP